MNMHDGRERGGHTAGWIVAKGLNPLSIMTRMKSSRPVADVDVAGNERTNRMSFPSKVTMVDDRSAAVELSLSLIESLQETLKQKRQQLEGIQSRMHSLVREYEQLDTAASDMAEQISGVMRGLEPDSSAPERARHAGQRKCA
jgi:uncharacterized phage infection (PIP) family protein YhgE